MHAKDELLAKVLSAYAPFNEATRLLVRQLRGADRDAAMREAAALIYGAIWASLLDRLHRHVVYSGDRTAVAMRVAANTYRRTPYWSGTEALIARAELYHAASQVLDERHPPGFEFSRVLRVNAGLPEWDILRGMTALTVYGGVYATVNELLVVFEANDLAALQRRFRRTRPIALYLMALLIVGILVWLLL